jgi:hypothetical protein
VSDAERLNADAQAGRLDGAALQQALQAQGECWYQSVQGRSLFAGVAVFISPVQLQQMTDVIAAVERVVKNEKGEERRGEGDAQGVFFGYDFLLNSDGAHLIEINSNAGGAFLNALLIGSQRAAVLPGSAVAEADPEQVFVEMFRREWQRTDVPLSCIAIVDEQPEQQYLYPEFLLAQRLFERAGILTCIADPAGLALRAEGLYAGEQKIDLVYNRLTDFSLQHYPDLLRAWQEGRVVLTPSPAHYARYADKRNLARLTDVAALRELGVADEDIAVLQAGIPHTFVVRPELDGELWSGRRQLFFKPRSGYGSKGAYRGEKLTRRVFGEILQADYVAQQLAAPGERCVSEQSTLKYDVRCYVYDGKIQLVAARLYQGQTTNFRTAGGGFAPVRVVG